MKEIKVTFVDPDQSSAGEDQTAIQETTINVPDDTTAANIQDALESGLVSLNDGGIKPVWMGLYTND